jgi:hypothetical protein
MASADHPKDYMVRDSSVLGPRRAGHVDGHEASDRRYQDFDRVMCRSGAVIFGTYPRDWKRHVELGPLGVILPVRACQICPADLDVVPGPLPGRRSERRFPVLLRVWVRGGCVCGRLAFGAPDLVGEWCVTKRGRRSDERPRSPTRSWRVRLTARRLSLVPPIGS